jgi:hypothetical protein
MITSKFVITNPEVEPPSRINIGLGLKMSSKNLEIPGYAQRKNGEWGYSQRAINLICEYKTAFPEIFSFSLENRDRLRNHTEQIQAADIFISNA